MKTIERAFAVLRALAEQPESAGVSEVARRVGLAKSTTSRILVSLQELGMVERVGDRFTIGPGLATLTHDPSPVASLRDIARPYLVELAESVGEGAALAVPDGDEIVYVDNAPVEAVVQVQDWTGLRFPCHTAAAGLALMATWPDGEIERYGRQPLVQYTPLTLSTADAVEARIAEVRRDGFAWTRGEFNDELNGVAAAVHDPDGVAVGAINISGPIFRFPGDRPESEITDELVAATRQIRDRL